MIESRRGQCQPARPFKPTASAAETTAPTVGREADGTFRYWRYTRYAFAICGGDGDNHVYGERG